MPKNRDPHYMRIRNGNMLSLHGKAKKSYAEDDQNFNAATMGNRQFKVMPTKRMKAAQAISDEARTAMRRAAANKLKKGRAARYKAMKGKYS